jgi:hypothetical protein
VQDALAAFRYKAKDARARPLESAVLWLLAGCAAAKRARDSQAGWAHSVGWIADNPTEQVQRHTGAAIAMAVSS